MTALTNITAPSRKLILTTIGLVVGAHLLTGGALSNMAPTALPKQILPEPKPIEVKMITLAPVEEKEPEPEVIKQKQAEPEVRRASAPKVVKKPPTSTKQAPKPKPKTQTKPPVSSRPPDNKPQKPKQDTNLPKENNNSGGSSSVNSDLPLTNIDENQTVVASSNGKQSLSANSGSQSNTGVSQGAGANEGSGSGGSPDPAPPPAPPAPDPAPPAPTGPVNFSASDASWIDPPKLEKVADMYFGGKQNAEAITVTLKLTVNKQGKVTNADVISGKVDASTRNQIIRATKKARLKPFTQNKAPVVGKVNVSFRLELP